MNSNWNRLKRKLKDNKQANPKRRRLNDTNTSNTRNKWISHKNKTKNVKSSNDNNQSFVTKYSNSSSSKSSTEDSFDHKIENYRKNTSRKQLFETINLIPPSSTNNDMEQRKQFWNNLRLKLRARLPKEFLFKLITPLSAQHDDDANTKHKSTKLHTIKASTKPTNVIALDCEMVGIGQNGSKSILARISMVNYYGDVIYDKFVKPINDPKCNKITDFREDITGITKGDLLKHGIEFEQCQKEIIQLLKGRRIIGHALHNDFTAIKCANVLRKNFYSTVITPSNADDDNNRKEKQLSKRKKRQLLQKKVNQGSWYFDTATCELLHDDLSRPRSLKFLLELYLGIHIQSEEHDSVIDAISTMAIYRAILPEIKQLTKSKKQSKKEKVDGQKEWLKRKEEEREKREIVRKNTRVMNNYAYDNSLDALIAQFDDRNGKMKDNFDKQLLSSNPYKK